MRVKLGDSSCGGGCQAGRAMRQAFVSQSHSERSAWLHKRRMSRRIALANDVDPSSFFELSYRLGIDSDAADFFDIAPRDGLPVSDNRKRFQYRAGIFGRFLKI